MAGPRSKARLSGKYLSSGCPRSGLRFLYCTFPAYCGFLHYLSSTYAESTPCLAHSYAHLHPLVKTYSDSLAQLHS